MKVQRYIVRALISNGDDVSRNLLFAIYVKDRRLRRLVGQSSQTSLITSYSGRCNHVQPTLLRGAVYTMQGVKLVTVHVKAKTYRRILDTSLVPERGHEPPS
jgi:hypothetical protein